MSSEKTVPSRPPSRGKAHTLDPDNHIEEASTSSQVTISERNGTSSVESSKLGTGTKPKITQKKSSTTSTPVAINKPPWCSNLKDDIRSRSPSKTDTKRVVPLSPSKTQGLFKQLELNLVNPLSPRCKTASISKDSKTNPGLRDSKSTNSSPSRTTSNYANTYSKSGPADGKTNSRSASPDPKSSKKDDISTNLKTKQTEILNGKLKLKVLTSLSNTSASSGKDSDVSVSKGTKKKSKTDTSSNIEDNQITVDSQMPADSQIPTDNQIPSETETELDESQINQLAKDLELPSFQAIVGRLHETAKMTVIETSDNKPSLNVDATEKTPISPENEDKQSGSTNDAECSALPYYGIEPFHRMLDDIIDCFERKTSVGNMSTSVEKEDPNSNLVETTALQNEAETKVENIIEPKPTVDEKETVFNDQVTKDEPNKPEEHQERPLSYGQVKIVINQTPKVPPVDEKSSKVSKASKSSEASKTSKASNSSKKSVSTKSSTGDSNNAEPQKKKRSIKNFFKKLFSFGRKKKDT